MAYNYGNFQYQPQPMYQYQTSIPMQSYQSQSVPQQQSNNQGFVWVQGEAGAKAYPVAAGNSVLLMDSENPVLYMKSTDSTGRPLPMETYDLVKRESAPIISHAQDPAPSVDLSQYVKMSDLEALVKKLISKELGGQGT